MIVKKNYRREFIKQSGQGLLAFTILPSFKNKVAPSDRVRVAHIGVGGMGNNHLKWFSGLPEVEVAAICDVDRTHLRNTLNTASELQADRKIDVYTDFRNVLDRNDIDAITCATPDHWHGQIANLAFQAGKDVYGEKPLSYDIAEGQLMLKNLNRYNRVFQLGTQIHAGDNYHRVAEIIQSGILGKIHTVRMWKNGAPPDLGFPKRQAIPKTLDWDMWLGPAPYEDYFPERCHFNYRYFLDYSGGEFADFWCHIADVVFWALNPKGLSSIEARGEPSVGIGNTPQWLEVDYKFEGLDLYWTTTPPDVPHAADKSIGAHFEGEKGTLVCNYGSRQITINGQTVEDLDEVPISLPRSPGHQQNFIDAVKTRNLAESHLAYAREMTLPMHLGLISYQLNRTLIWDSVMERCVGDKSANRMLSRRARKKWNLV